MKALPPNVSPYKKTPIFTEETLPDGLLKNHTTMKDVWGKIVVLAGSLIFTIEKNGETGDEVENIILTTERFGVIEPQVPHHVKPEGKVHFFVEFLKEKK